MIEKDRAAVDQFETSTAANQLMSDQRYRPMQKTVAFGLIAQGAQEHEAKEHDLPLVRQGRA
jgi:hypothetical protein